MEELTKLFFVIYSTGDLGRDGCHFIVIVGTDIVRLGVLSVLYRLGGILRRGGGRGIALAFGWSSDFVRRFVSASADRFG